LLSSLKNSQEYTEIENIYNTGLAPVKNEDLTGSIKGRNTIYGHLREIAENAEKEVIICLPLRDFSDKLRIFTAMIENLKSTE
jgi:sugar-specific transcriptional regulator TrmB